MIMFFMFKLYAQNSLVLHLFYPYFPVNSKNTWNDNLAAIFETKLKAAIDNRGVKK